MAIVILSVMNQTARREWRELQCVAVAGVVAYVKAASAAIWAAPARRLVSMMA
jgi:hypothetical protein